MPLTGAEKQRRHRERVKARLVEAEALRARLGAAEAGALASLRVYCEAVLVEVGADFGEREAFAGKRAAIEAEIDALIRERCARGLEQLRAKRRSARSSLLARLSPVKPEGLD
jgi:hypothetical protein